MDAAPRRKIFGFFHTISAVKTWSDEKFRGRDQLIACQVLPPGMPAALACTLCGARSRHALPARQVHGLCVCVYSFLYTSEGGRASTTTTLHVGTGYHATAGLPHGSVNAKTKMQGEMQPVRILFRSERRSARKSRRVEALILSTSTAEEPVEIYTGAGRQTWQLWFTA